MGEGPAQEVLRIARLSDDLKARFGQQARDPLAQEHVVLTNDDTERRRHGASVSRLSERALVLTMDLASGGAYMHDAAGGVRFPRNGLASVSAEIAMQAGQAARMAAARIEEVRASTESRYRLAEAFYRRRNTSKEHGRYGRGELSFLRWQIHRGVLDVPSADGGGSPWWRAISDTLLRDQVEADLLLDAPVGGASSRNVALWIDFIRTPSADSWYVAHNASVVAGYLAHEDLARRELKVERFMINVALIRVIYAHALVAAPRLALGILAPLGRLLGDPRRRSIGVFLDLHNQFPDPYPPRGWSMDDLLAEHGRLAQVIDYGLIPSDLTALYGFAADALDEPRLTTLLNDGTPCYVWPAEERAPWLAGATRPLARAIARAAGHPYR